MLTRRKVIEPECLKLVLDEVLLDHDIEVLLHTTVVGATRSESSVVSIEVQERRGRRQLLGKAFVDCSGDCDLAHHCGASTRYGNHGTVNLGSLSTRFGGISSNTTPTAAGWRDAIVAAKQKDPSLRNLIKKSQSVLLRLPLSGDIVSFLASAEYDARESASVTAAEISGRQQARKYLEILRSLPGHEKMYLVATGPNFGTRESRHINAKYQLTENDIMSNRAFPDKIALGAWGVEFHDAGQQNWESTFAYLPAGTFEIPLGCLCSVDTDNLVAAGRGVDGDQHAGSAIRVMGTALVTGQAAGVTAALIARKPKGSSIDAKEVQTILERNGALLNSDRLPDAGPVDDLG